MPVKTFKTLKRDDPRDGMPCDGGDSCPGKNITDMSGKGALGARHD